jgi:hypothetical protein
LKKPSLSSSLLSTDNPLGVGLSDLGLVLETLEGLLLSPTILRFSLVLSLTLDFTERFLLDLVVGGGKIDWTNPGCVDCLNPILD